MIEPSKIAGRNTDLVGNLQWTPATYEIVAVDPADGDGIIAITLSGEVCGAFGRSCPARWCRSGCGEPARRSALRWLA
jgi:hypothetical protein